MATERTVLVRLKAEVSDFVRDMSLAGAAVRGLSKDIDTTNNRTAWMVQGFLALAPALVPLGAAATPILAGIVTQMTIGAAAAGVLALGLVGIGDGLKAVNAYQLDPTAATLEKMRQELEKLGPDGAEFVQFLDSIGPKLSSLRMAAREGMLPGFEDGITSLLTKLPTFRDIVSRIAAGLGQLGREAGAGLAGPGFEDFFNFLKTDAQPILLDMGRTFGNFVEGLANMIVAFAPMSRDFSAGFLGMSRDFAAWSHGLEDNQSFQNFVSYVQESVPRALDFLSSLGDAFLQIVEAAAPVGDVLLPILSQFFDVIAMIANTPIGSIFIAMAASVAILGRSIALAGLATAGLGKAIISLGAAFGINAAGLRANIALMSQFGTMSLAGVRQQQAAAASVRTTLLKSGALLAGFAVLSSGVADSFGLQNTAMLGLVGTMIGPYGGAIGLAAGYTIDFAKAGGKADDIIDKFNHTLESGHGSAQSYATGLKEMQADADEFAASVSSPNFFGQLGKGLTPGGLKNNLDVIFGGYESSSLGKLDEQILKSQQDMGDLELGARLLGDELQVGGISDGALTIAEMDKVLQTAGPAMQALGISTEEFVAAVKDGSITGMVEDIQAWMVASDTVAGRTDAVVAALSGLEGEALTAAQAADELKSSLDNLFGVEIDQQEAVDNWYDSLADLRKGLKDTNGMVFGQSHALRENRDLINASVEAMLDRALADARVEKSGTKFVNTLLQGRAAIIAEAKAQGIRGEQIEKYLNSLKLTPKQIATQILTPGLLTAIEQFKALSLLYHTTPKKVSTLIAAVGAAKTEGEVTRLLHKYGLTRGEFKSLLSTRDDASPKVKKAQEALKKFDRTKANPVVDAVITNAMAKFGVVIKKADDVDKKHPKPKVTADTATASTMLQGIINKIAGIHDKDVTITVTHTDILNRIVNKVDPYHSAAGNFFAAENQYAAGGMDIPDGHRPEFASPGSTRIWREPETQGESYIPHADDWRRPNALSVLEQTANLFGLTVQRRFAEGGVAWAQEARKAMRYADGGYVQASRMNTGGYTSRSSGSEMVGRAVVELRTPWGTQEVDVLMRGVSREEYDADRGFERVRAGA